MTQLSIITPDQEEYIPLDLERLRAKAKDEGFFSIGNTMHSTEHPPAYDVTVFAGIDMEYVNKLLNRNKNDLLSIQLVFVSPWGGGKLCILCKGGKRLSLRQIAKKVVKALSFPPNVDTTRINLILIAHYVVAEWSHLEDRDAKEVMRHLAYLRKTLVTARPIKNR